MSKPVPPTIRIIEIDPNRYVARTYLNLQKGGDKYIDMPIDFRNAARLIIDLGKAVEALSNPRPLR